MTDILDRLEHEPSYYLQSDEKQLRRDAADEIIVLRAEIAILLATVEKWEASK